MMKVSAILCMQCALNKTLAAQEVAIKICCHSLG